MTEQAPRERCDLLIRGGTVMTFDPAIGDMADGAVAISGRRIAYSVTGKGRSSIRIYRIDLQTTGRVLQTPIWSYSHASISGDSVVYVRQAASGAAVWHLDLVSGRSHRVYRVPHGTGRALWSTATNGASAYFTVYTKSESLIWHA